MRRSADQLHKLADLKDQGILTDAEFETEKAKILASLSAGATTIRTLQPERANEDLSRRTGDTMTIGPVSYTVIAFPGNQFNGNIAPEVAKLVASGTVRILDLVFVAKDEQGDTISLEFDQMDELAAFNDIDGEVGGLVNAEDLDHVAANLPEGNSALVILWEDLWAVPLVEAIRGSGGVLIDSARIPNDLIEAAFEDLAAALKS